ncbi:hypothetical protein FPV67DRAFT_1419584 [Lyophyllum atratum]|nr:hypothetical protein FPV67DRAFT_1419584 [Lyophyllum atratum]
MFHPSATTTGISSHARKKENQWSMWMNVVIPSLLTPFLSLLRETDSLRNPVSPDSAIFCDCTSRKQINVACIYFDRINMIQICSCTAATQLLSRGLFPCAPKQPSLAVDLNMLDFVRELFLRSPPNNTAWCDTLDGFLAKRKYKLKTMGSLRRRFATAFHWYQRLVNKKDEYVKAKISMARKENMRYMMKIVRGIPLTNLILSYISYEPASNSMPPPVHSEDEEDEDTSETSTPLSRPSDYLRSRCPLCYGSNAFGSKDFKVDSIHTLDACFTQKSRHNPRGGGRGPADIHPDTVFLSEKQVKDMELLVEEMRPSRPSARKPKASQKDADDGIEAFMRVPTSVLDACHESFTAADEKRVKASTKFFSDTGLMALLCRHDRVFWLVNMTSPGERQHYALALIKQLFDHLPSTMTVGVLYDIGCQLHRSCVKWDFLNSEVFSRIIWGLSVFHAFGHQWPCQVIYHPRKCSGFGLSDGEGCERFWSSIKGLIPSLRVSGHYQRLYSIDRQVEYLNEKSLHGLGIWLARKWDQCKKRKEKAEKVLEEINIPAATLRTEWEAQVIEQTKPLKKQSKTAGNKAVEEVLSLLETRKIYKARLDTLDQMLSTGSYQSLDAEELRDQRAATQRNYDTTQKTIEKKRSALGVDGRHNLSNLKDNKFIQLRVNAAALKHRIRTRLRDRKFELDRLERAYRQTKSNEVKLHNHIKGSVKRHEPTIMNLATKYNNLCSEMAALKAAQSGATPGLVPSKIEKDKLFDLDVDDNIWQDIGLQDDEFSGTVPLWLGDENTRRGIKALLEFDRCVEEEQRLAMERCSLQEWMLEEWSCVILALEASFENGDLDLTYQLREERARLRRLCALWKSKTQGLPARYAMPETWGPSKEELEQAEMEEISPSWDVDDNVESEGSASEEMDADDEELLEAIEISALTDAYREENIFENASGSSSESWSVIPQASLQLQGTRRPSRDTSPKKRSRRDSSL